jgi:glycine/D-amino acid oxidase-like deaminating enzyme
VGERVRLSWAGGEVLAHSAVLAVNAHAGPLVPALAPRLQPVGLEALAAATTPRRVRGLWIAGADALAVRQLADGTVIAARRAGGEPGFLETPTAGGQAGLEEQLQRCFPALGRLAVVQRWAGTDAVTADGLPWVRSVPGVPGAAYACGFNGGGLSLGFALGRRLARWAGDREERHLALFQPVPAAV